MQRLEPRCRLRGEAPREGNGHSTGFTGFGREEKIFKSVPAGGGFQRHMKKEFACRACRAVSEWVGFQGQAGCLRVQNTRLRVAHDGGPDVSQNVGMLKCFKPVP